MNYFADHCLEAEVIECSGWLVRLPKKAGGLYIRFAMQFLINGLSCV